VYLSLKNHCSTYSDSDILRSGDADCRLWLSAKEKFQRDSASRVSGNLKFWNQIAQEDSMWRRVLGKEVYRLKDMEAYLETHPSNHNYYLPSFRGRDSIRTNLDQLAAIEEAKVQLMKKYSQDPIVYREQMIGDDYNNFNDRFYGNSFVSTSSTDANHGTHVAGIIGAVRNNKKGMDGIADAVKIMAVRAVPADADEYDKDVALAIHYAVDNGAKVINMSFGKPYSPQRAWVQEAILYAAKHDVLIVHAAGNDASNVDSVFFYPTSKLDSAGYANNVITVGASGAERANLIGSFSNYGKASVDVFAPGVQIYSSVYKNDTSKYAVYSGTSMASPVVAGLAAVLRSYYPRLSAVQVKSLIERSVTKIDGYVKMPGAGKREVTMKELCRTGGIVNAYRAVKMAAELVSRKKT
jgi:subtilisin family serine protease